jgi:hypothetical protein
MAALNFPSSPVLNQVFTANGKSWRYDGSSWKTFYVLGVPSGGTGNTSYVNGDILVGAGTSMFALPIGTNNYVLTVDNTAPFLIAWKPTAASGITTLNGISSGLQYLEAGFSGATFNIASSGSTHTINIPIAGSGATGLVSTQSQTFAGAKTFSSDLSVTSASSSISTGSGAFVVTGGVGIGGSLFVNSASNISGLVFNNGVVTSGSWAGSLITSFYGGTGQSTYTKGDLLVGTGATLSKFSVGTDTYVLTADSTSSTGVTWKAASAAGTTVIGTPTDGLYTDGFFNEWTSSTTISNAFDDVNELLALIAPAKPGTLSGTTLTATSTPTYYTAKIAAGLGTEWYQAGYGTGDTISSRYFVTGSHTLSTASTTTRFYAGTLVTSTYGILKFNIANYLASSGATYGQIDMTTSYAVNTTNNNLVLTALDVYNSIWTKANARISSYTPSHSGYQGLSIAHTTETQTTDTYNIWYDAWSNGRSPSFSQSATASTYSQSLKWLSGIGYYTTGTGFSVYFKGAAGIYSACYNVTQTYAISATGLVTSTGLPASPPLYTDELDKSGANHVRVSLNSASASSFNKYLTVTLYKAHNTTAASNASIARSINTYGTVSTDTYDGFQDEARRLVIGTGIGFTSTIDMANGNAQVRSGTLQYPLAADYDTEWGGTHTFTGDQEYQRYFYKTSASTGSLTFGGFTASNIAAYGTGSINVLLYLEGDAKWFDLGVLQGSNANDGSSRAQAISAKTSTSSGTVNWSLGTSTTGVSGAGNSGRYRAVIILRNNTYSMTSITSA